VTNELAKDLGQLLKASPGSCKVNVQIVSQADNLAVEAPSKGFSVAVTEELVRGLDGMAEVKWTLN